MKIGFSSLTCPSWDLETIVTQAATLGFQGVELRGLQGELHLPLVPELAARPDQVRTMFQDRGVELVCLGSSATFDSRDKKEVARQKGIVTEFIELAAKLQCPYVRIFAGEVQRWDNHRAALSRIADALRALVPIASRARVTLLIANGGDFSSSEDIWFLIDAVDHPALQACWSQCSAMTQRERPTNSIPRLGRKIGAVHLCDASFDEEGALLAYQPLGQGNGEIAKQIELLRGLAYDRYLIFEWPKMWDESLPSPETVLPSVAGFLKQCLESKQPILSAYKGDKQAPRLAARSTLAGRV